MLIQSPKAFSGTLCPKVFWFAIAPDPGLYLPGKMQDPLLTQ